MRWQEAVGYGQRSHAETAMSRYKAIIGSGLRARTLPAQKSRPRSPARRSTGWPASACQCRSGSPETASGARTTTMIRVVHQRLSQTHRIIPASVSRFRPTKSRPNADECEPLHLAAFFCRRSMRKTKLQRDPGSARINNTPDHCDGHRRHCGSGCDAEAACPLTKPVQAAAVADLARTPEKRQAPSPAL